MKPNLSDPMSQYGSAPKKRAKSSRQEESMQTAICTYFKLQYSGFPYRVDEIVGKRSKAAQNVLKKQQFMPGYPDMFFPVARAGYHGMYLENKKSWKELFYEDGVYMKPGNEQHHIWQAVFHEYLREQGYWVQFNWSKEQGIELIDSYMKGRPKDMFIPKYEWDAKRMQQFVGIKHFRPVGYVKPDLGIFDKVINY